MVATHQHGTAHKLRMHRLYKPTLAEHCKAPKVSTREQNLSKQIAAGQRVQLSLDWPGGVEACVDGNDSARWEGHLLVVVPRKVLQESLQSKDESNAKGV